MPTYPNGVWSIWVDGILYWMKINNKTSKWNNQNTLDLIEEKNVANRLPKQELILQMFPKASF